jgi:hypothetical protein
MNPNLVMSDEEKRERFKHYFKKKEEKNLALEKSSQNAETSSTIWNIYPRKILPK